MFWFFLSLLITILIVLLLLYKTKLSNIKFKNKINKAIENNENIYLILDKEFVDNIENSIDSFSKKYCDMWGNSFENIYYKFIINKQNGFKLIDNHLKNNSNSFDLNLLIGNHMFLKFDKE